MDPSPTSEPPNIMDQEKTLDSFKKLIKDHFTKYDNLIFLRRGGWNNPYITINRTADDLYEEVTSTSSKSHNLEEVLTICYTTIIQDHSIGITVNTVDPRQIGWSGPDNILHFDKKCATFPKLIIDQRHTNILWLHDNELLCKCAYTDKLKDILYLAQLWKKMSIAAYGIP